MTVSIRTTTILLFTVFLVLVLSPIDSGITAPRPEKPRDDRTSFTNDCQLGVVDPSAGEQVLADNDILYVKDALLAGAIVLNDDSPLSGEVGARVSGSWNTTALFGSFDGKWTITTVNGTFEGSIVGTISVATISGRFVGRGTDALQGQKIKGTFAGTVNNYVADLTLSGDLTATANVKLKKQMVMTPILTFVE